MARLFIFGTSGFSKETRDIAAELGWDCSFIAASASEYDTWSGDEDVILESDIEKIENQFFAIGIGDNSTRKKIAQLYNKKLKFVNLIHPSASFGCKQLDVFDNIVGTIICAGARFTSNISIGNFSIFNLNCTVGHDAVIGDFVNVAPGANISGYVDIHEGCWIGTNAAVNQGKEGAALKIERNTIIGSGSVVVKNCDPESVYVGIPARKI